MIQTKVSAADRIADDEGVEITSATVATLKAKRSVFDQVNSVLSQANLAAQIRLSSSNEAVAIRGDQELPVSRMSDGERTALILAAEVLTAAADTTFLIDEPEIRSSIEATSSRSSVACWSISYCSRPSC